MYKKRNFVFSLPLFLLIGGIVLVLLVLVKPLEFFSFKDRADKLIHINENEECLVEKEERIVKGNSLFPLFLDGETVKILFNYYECNEVERDDVVLYYYAGSSVPLIKIARGVGGDSFELVEKSESKWHILINGKVLKNSKNDAYLISKKGYEMLSLYEKDFEKEIPGEALLLLGDNPSGTLDSTRFGFVSEKNISAKVEY